MIRKQVPEDFRCKHCKLRKMKARSRGLCSSCSSNKEISKLYPSTSKFARRGHGTSTGGYVLPLVPTASLPGSAERKAILQERARLGRSLFHPDDAKGS